jgi:hypothetical protein
MQTTTLKSKRSQTEDPHLVSGGYIPRSGIYTPLHPHRRTGSVALLKNNSFPLCRVCGLAASYASVSWVSHESASARFRLLMHTRQSMEVASR